MFAKTALLAFALSAAAAPLDPRQVLRPGETPRPNCVGECKAVVTGADKREVLLPGEQPHPHFVGTSGVALPDKAAVTDKRAPVVVPPGSDFHIPQPASCKKGGFCPVSLRRDDVDSFYADGGRQPHPARDLPVDPITGHNVMDHGLALPPVQGAAEKRTLAPQPLLPVDPVTGDPVEDHGLEHARRFAIPPGSGIKPLPQSEACKDGKDGALCPVALRRAFVDPVTGHPVADHGLELPRTDSLFGGRTRRDIVARVLQVGGQDEHERARRLEVPAGTQQAGSCIGSCA